MKNRLLKLTIIGLYCLFISVVSYSTESRFTAWHSVEVQASLRIGIVLLLLDRIEQTFYPMRGKW